jgi:hypothetical protein
LGAPGGIGVDPVLSKNHLAWPAGGDMPVLSILFALRLSGSLQVWCTERLNNGCLEGIALQSFQ